MCPETFRLIPKALANESGPFPASGLQVLELRSIGIGDIEPVADVEVVSRHAARYYEATSAALIQDRPGP